MTTNICPLKSPKLKMNMNIGNFVLPHDARGQGPLSPQMKQATTSNILNFGSCKPIHPETGSSFRSLSSSPPLSQYECPRQLNVQSSNGDCIPDASSQGNVGTVPNWPLLQSFTNLNVIAGVDVCPIFPLRPTTNASNGSSCGLNDELDALRALITQAGSRNESRITCSPSSSNSTVVDGSLQAASSISNKQNSVVSGCPRVFCMGACGDLLVSSTGLFGILCSCHGMHMSVSKFCEHSGLSDVNPGYAVHMDSGESIAQWRKVYLQKFRIRAPGDHRGWDWPEGLLATSGLANSSMAVADRRKVFDLSSLFNSSAERVNSTQPWNNVTTSRPRPNEEYSDQILKNAQRQNGWSECNIGGSRRNSHDMTDDPKIACPSIRSLIPSLPGGKEGSGDDFRSWPFDFISSRENLFSSTRQNLHSVGSKTRNILKDDIILQRSKIPSSIELKLGQPSQLNWGSGFAALSAVRPHTTGIQIVQEKPIHNLANAKVSEHNKQHIFCHSASDFSRTKESFPAGLLKNAPTSFQEVPLNNAQTLTNGSAHAKHLKDGLQNSFSVSLPVPPSDTVAGGTLYHKEINNQMMDGHPSSPWTNHYRPHTDRSVLVDFSYNGNALTKPLDFNKLALLNNKSRTIDAACGHKDSNVGSESSSRFYSKQMESSVFTRKGKFSNPNSSPLPAVNNNPLGMANMLCGVSGASSYVANACILESNLVQNHLSFKATPTMQATSTGFTPLSAVLAPGHGSASSSKDVETANSHISDESLRFLSLMNVDESFKEKPMDASPFINQRPRIYSDQSQQSKNCSIFDLRAQGLLVDQRPFEGERHGQPSPVGHIVSPSFLPDAGDKKGTNLNVINEEMTLHFKLLGKYNKDLCSPQLKQQFSQSVGRRENMECDCNMVQRCLGGSSHISDKSNCYAQAGVCLKREQDCSDSSSMYGLQKKASVTVLEAPKCNSSRFTSDCVSFEKAFLVECSQQVKEQNFKLDCGMSQWADVPSKEMEVSKMRCSNSPMHILDTREEYEASLKNLTPTCFPRSNQTSELSKGEELSDISSGCSVPAVTQASNEVNIINSRVVDAGDTVCDSGQIVDQGSAISRSCSSVEAIDSFRSSQLVCDGKHRSTEEKSLMVLANVARHGLMNEYKQGHSKSNEVLNFTVSGRISGEVSNETQNENGLKPRKRKSITNRGGLYSSRILNDDATYNSLKRRSALFSGKMLSRKRDLNGNYNIVESDADDQTLLSGNDDSMDIPENAAVERPKQVKLAENIRKQMKATEAVKNYWLHDPFCNEKLKYNSKGRVKVKPVACGKYGIICDQELDIDQLKPPKIVPLSQVLKASKRHANFEKGPVASSMRKKYRMRKNNVHCSNGRKCLNGAQGSQCNELLSCHSRDIDASIQESQQVNLDITHSDDFVVPEELGTNGGEINLSVSSCRPASLSKTKGVRTRSLYELCMKDISRSQNLMCAPSTVCGLEMITGEGPGRRDGIERRVSGRRSCSKLHCRSLMSEIGELCCVCGISDKDNSDCLLECGHCLIRVHQACYGITRVPKGDWYCRPCRTSSKDVACVLCGYGGGAMTRAFGCRNVVRSLLKAWDVRSEPHIMSIGSAEALYVPAKMESRTNLESATYKLSPLIKPVVHNSIISGLFDPTVKQWVHMVCGLWTPGTRCPNVDTMSAFDVSGVSHLKEYVVCYICKRAGGSCIRCRVEACYTHFHSWCAYQKGLLQSEVEEVDSDKIGFYGRCLLHANSTTCRSENDNYTHTADGETEQQEPTCARTEGYQGKKLGDGRHYTSYQHCGKGRCLVPQVQLDAWLYINRHKLSMSRWPKLPISDVDHDFRKEYARYKQVKGWKHLVVYKSGIHALGLYMSQFIQRGAMVVEYVGEIVGHRVADKREAEYLSGRKLQYKSACYFFRVDKEQIIDATCKGGIARFVNHSCQPNCVAKVLTVRGEKKVVFFAQRDINPGEEITYDYHFNNEDEGKKIPCFCNSKNCRRYLN